ncbi:MAG: hypothetical protein ACT4PO_15835, partial [Actinomycetota bacterium]
ALKDTIAKGVQQGLFGYAAKGEAGYVSAAFQEGLDPEGVEFSDDVVLLVPDRAQEVKAAEPTIETPVPPAGTPVPPVTVGPGGAEQVSIFTGEKVAAIRWEGEVPWQKWITFYNKVLSGLAGGDLKVTVEFESRPPEGLLKERVETVKDNLSELGLSPDVATEDQPPEDGDV